MLHHRPRGGIARFCQVERAKSLMRTKWGKISLVHHTGCTLVTSYWVQSYMLSLLALLKELGVCSAEPLPHFFTRPRHNLQLIFSLRPSTNQPTTKLGWRCSANSSRKYPAWAFSLRRDTVEYATYVWVGDSIWWLLRQFQTQKF